jgi:RNA recognition motif-containing protein
MENEQTNNAEENNENQDEILPKQTIYINNLNERIKKEELRKSLYAMFSQFGIILDVVALKTLKMRGQAFIVFKDTVSATNAMRAMQNFPFYDKPMRIQYAQTRSDIIAKLEGTFVPRKKSQVKAEPKPEKRKATEDTQQADASNKKAKKGEAKKAEKKKQEESSGGAAGTGVTPAHLQPKQLPPNRILFVENLPEQATELMLQMLFQQYPGFKEVRMVQGKQGIAFVEYQSEYEAGTAMTQLQHFKITPTNIMVISYAKK